MYFILVGKKIFFLEVKKRTNGFQVYIHLFGMYIFFS